MFIEWESEGESSYRLVEELDPLTCMAFFPISNLCSTLFCIYWERTYWYIMWHRLLAQYYPSQNGGRHGSTESPGAMKKPQQLLQRRTQIRRRPPWRRCKTPVSMQQNKEKENSNDTISRLLSLDKSPENDDSDFFCWNEKEDENDWKLSSVTMVPAEASRLRQGPEEDRGSEKIESNAWIQFDATKEPFTCASTNQEGEFVNNDNDHDDNDDADADDDCPSHVDGSVMTMPSLVDNTVATVTTFNTIPSLLDHTVTTVGDDDLGVDVDVDFTVTTSTVGLAEDTIEKAVNAVLQDHHNHNRDMIFLTRRRESSLLVARRDSCSTISTAPDTPESPLVISEFLICYDSPQGDRITTTTTINDAAPTTTTKSQLIEPCHCPSLSCPRCTTCLAWPLEFFFVHSDPPFPADLPGIRKSKKFVPDPMTVGDFYGDDDEDIRFVPQSFEEEIVFGAMPNHLDHPKDDDDRDHDDDYDATTTITTWGDDPDTDNDELDSAIFSDGSGSDIISYLTGDGTLVQDTRIPQQLQKSTQPEQSLDEYNHSLLVKSWELSKPLNAEAMTKMKHPVEELHSTMNRSCVDRNIVGHINPTKQTDAHATRETILSTRTGQTLCRYPSVGLDHGVLPPSRNNYSILVPPRDNFPVTRLEI